MDMARRHGLTDLAGRCNAGAGQAPDGLLHAPHTRGTCACSHGARPCGGAGHRLLIALALPGCHSAWVLHLVAVLVKAPLVPPRLAFRVQGVGGRWA